MIRRLNEVPEPNDEQIVGSDVYMIWLFIGIALACFVLLWLVVYYYAP